MTILRNWKSRLENLLSSSDDDTCPDNYSLMDDSSTNSPNSPWETWVVDNNNNSLSRAVDSRSYTSTFLRNSGTQSSSYYTVSSAVSSTAYFTGNNLPPGYLNLIITPEAHLSAMRIYEKCRENFIQILKDVVLLPSAREWKFTETLAVFPSLQSGFIDGAEMVAKEVILDKGFEMGPIVFSEDGEYVDLKNGFDGNHRTYVVDRLNWMIKDAKSALRESRSLPDVRQYIVGNILFFHEAKKAFASKKGV